MNTDELTLTIDELDELCRLYMDCRLSVLEEKELEYILSKTSFTSPLIQEVKCIMKLQVVKPEYIMPRNNNFPIRKYFSGIAASLAIIFSVGYFFLSSKHSDLSDSDSSVFIAAYSHGEQLSYKEALNATHSAIEKADSLMNLAALTEREYLLKANDIINGTSIN